MKSIIANVLSERYDALIAANGAPLPRGLFMQLRRRSDLLIALDGGANTLMRWGLVPDHIVGDLDSADSQVIGWATEHGGTVHRHPVQDKPDIAKGLDLCRKLHCKNALVTNFTGSRTDHELASLYFVFRARGVSIHIVSSESVLIPLAGRVNRTFQLEKGQLISWFGFPRAQSCTLTGTRWPVRKQVLDIAGFHSLSNCAAAETVEVTQHSGRSLLIFSLNRSRGQ